MMQKNKYYSLSSAAPTTDEALSEMAHRLNRSVRKSDIAIYGNGQWALKAKDQFIFLAWLIDLAVVYIPAAAVYLYFAKNYGFTSGAAVGYGALALGGSSWLYGFICGYRRTLGGVIARTRLVRLKDGEILKFWRSGWVMFVRTTLFPVLIVVMGMGASGGGSPTVTNGKEYHVSLDDSAMADLASLSSLKRRD